MGRLGTVPDEVALWRLPRARYERMVEAGAFGPKDRVELLDGLLVVGEPQGHRHATVVVLVRRALERAFRRGCHVREEKPLALDALSEPEPDLAVVRGRPLDYLDAHPSSALLIVEVADTSLALDRLRKAELYARARVPEYWIVNLVDGVLEVYRRPARGRPPRGGWAYRQVRLLRRGMLVTPLGAPGARIRVARLLA
jgi:Uma2 family endonuclease